MKLTNSVESIKGVGVETSKKLAKLGIISVHDLLTNWPRRYDDYSQVQTIQDIEPGAVTIKAKVESIKSRRVRRGMHLTEAVLRDETSAVRVIWFNQPYREKSFKSGMEYYFSGVYDFSYNKYILQNPTVEEAKDFTKNTARIVPIYAQTKGLHSREIRSMVSEIITVFAQLEETLPQSVIMAHSFMPYREAARQLHFPDNQEALQQAKDRIGFEEVFAYVLAGQLNKRQNDDEIALPISFHTDAATTYTGALPFELTPAQKKAAWEILQDIDSQSPMNRLLEGDVGSGKTVVAAFAAFMAAKQGVQTAVMAPTELLANQHAKTLADLLEPLGVRIGLMTAAVKAKQKNTLKQQLQLGEVDIVIGTHALLQESVAFHRLGFIVVDEQHRFGVKQRQKLVDKAKKVPHILSMTATPIPRSLALTVYGELDISIINQKPRNRLPIKTVIHSPSSRAQLYEDVETQIRQGRQVFVVCPLIDESEKSELKSVTEEVARLKKDVLKKHRIGTLHGKMKDDEKAAVMQQFLQRELDILVSTTVIEVGIDVPNASVMIIEGADHFGLAQLHQLRGRVGRGEHQGYCFLLPSTSAKPSKRLRAMEQTNNGFTLAQMDLELRGPGAVYGTRQHGSLDLRIANITDTHLIKQAKDAAETFMQSDEPLEQYPDLKNRVEKNRGLTYLN